MLEYFRNEIVVDRSDTFMDFVDKVEGGKVIIFNQPVGVPSEYTKLFTEQSENSWRQTSKNIVYKLFSNIWAGLRAREITGEIVILSRVRQDVFDVQIISDVYVPAEAHQA